MESPCALIFFMRNPVPGKVKTRLAAGIGDEAACDLYASFVQDMLSMLERTGGEIHVFFWPPEEPPQMKTPYPLHPQKGASLGERMQNAFEEIFSQGYDKALLMGSDIPDLPMDIIQEAEKLLEENACVLGPSEDGGYFLVGFTKKGFFPSIFSGPEWGTSKVLAQTLDVLQQSRIPCGLTTPWKDVDDLEDLKILLQRLSRGEAAAGETLHKLEELRRTHPQILD
ncbi:TIGR04282 family arsenosugar biosynthesis glycosyltransferase [Desulfatibacillum aliphaticivorans]|uniref:TIGR04282 family arsenosugar biosynthesis glycosyltransferase n=1 Tax=Desulfatibacillum aliphaticivorans TaxID=218208 RepID=UPI0003F926B6|nr:TIGR04282 family arsenosugar biosynthesis glycosyltransferase [Desulfatibacillum aliphaticivorans]